MNLHLPELAPSAVAQTAMSPQATSPAALPCGKPPRIQYAAASSTIDAPGRLPESSWGDFAPYTTHANLSLHCPRRTAVSRCKTKVLLLCTGPNEREFSLLSLLVKSGSDAESWDLVDGPTFDLADDELTGKQPGATIDDGACSVRLANRRVEARNGKELTGEPPRATITGGALTLTAGIGTCRHTDGRASGEVA